MDNTVTGGYEVPGMLAVIVAVDIPGIGVGAVAIVTVTVCGGGLVPHAVKPKLSDTPNTNRMIIVSSVLRFFLRL